MIDDFRLAADDRVLHVVSAPSPADTARPTTAALIVSRIADWFREARRGDPRVSPMGRPAQPPR
jgi:hypothetical protein